jgi:hypothetical protein
LYVLFNKSTIQQRIIIPQKDLSMAAADLKIDEEADEMIGELKGNYPLVAQILD